MKTQSLSLLALSACLVPEPEPEVTEVEQAVTCPDWMCGSNSPMIEHLGLSDLNVRGVRNANGFRLVRFDKGGKTYQMSVVGAEIRGVATDGSTISNNGTVGATMRILHTSGLRYEIRIAQVKGINYWAQRDSQMRNTWTYELEWSTDDGTPSAHKVWKNICSAPGAEDPGEMNKYHSVVFEGDRIDPRRKVVYAVEPDWFNIGCAGHALAKLHLTGHSEGARNGDGYITSLGERTTLLKMLTADYCGTGKVFTVAGVKLTWKDDKQWMVYDPIDADLEARWTPQGASCLNKPRLDANPTELGDDIFDNLETAISAECHRPPLCTPTGIRHHLLSANP